MEADVSDVAPPEVTIFVGRRREQAELEAAFTRACAGSGALFVVTGEPGIGKTRLAEEVARAVGGRAQVLWGRCREEAGAPAYWPWLQILESSAIGRGGEALAQLSGEGFAALAALLPGLARHRPSHELRPRLESEDARFYLFDAVARLVRAVADAQPLLLVLDDVHAADASSLLLLAFVAQELRTARVLAIATHRDAPIDVDARCAAALADLGRRAERLRLAGFGEAEVEEYIHRRFDTAPASGVVRAIHRTTEGNPFFVDEIAHALWQEGRLVDDAAARGDLPVPHTLRALIRDRLGPLGARSRRALQVAAAAGRAVDLGLLEMASGMTRAQLLAAMAEARAAGVVREAPEALGRYVFSHAIVRDALYEDLDEPQRVVVHGRIADALERLHAANLEPHLGEIAYHCARAALGGDARRAVEYAVRAGRRAVALLAYEVAAAHFEQALQALASCPPVDERLRGEILLLLGAAALRAGDLDRGRRANLEAAELAHHLAWPDGEARAALALGGPWVEIGGVDLQLQGLLERALDALGSADSVARVQVMARLARELYWSDAPQRAVALADAALDMARRLDDAGALAAALTARAYALWQPDSLDERLAVDAQIVSLADEASDAEMELRGRLWLASDLLERGDAERFERAMDVYDRRAADLRQPAYLWYAERGRAMRALLRGEFDAAERLAAAAHVIGVSTHRGLADQAQAILAVALRWERGEVSGLPEALELFRQRYPGVAAWPCGQAFLYAEQGNEQAARSAIERIGTELRHDATWLLSTALLSLACADIDDTERAAELYARLHPYRGRGVTMGRALLFFGSTSHFLGTLAAVLERWDEAEAHFAEALALQNRLGARPWSARTRARWARMLAARGAEGDRGRALALFDEAIAAADELGMRRLAERSRQRRRRCAEPPGAAAPPAQRTAAGVFRRDGDTWRVGFDGSELQLRDSKGMRCLALLLRHPHHAFHALELDQATAQGPRTAGGAEVPRAMAGGPIGRPMAGDELIDARARAEYRTRLGDLRSELDEATVMNDLERARRLREELDHLTDVLGKALGLGGRTRRMGSVQERARINVTKHVKAAIRHIGARLPGLGDALARAVRTGRLCAYVPDPRAPIDWEL